MSVLKKLTEARLMLASIKMTKSGHNSYAKFYYYELEDFLPHVTKINHDIGLIVSMRFDPEPLQLPTEPNAAQPPRRGMIVAEVRDADGDMDQTPLVFTSPYTEDAMNGNVLGIQKLGSVHTYMRRYMYLLIYDITEADALNASIGKPDKQRPPSEREDISDLIKIAEANGITRHQLTVSADKKWGIKNLTDLNEEQVKYIKDGIIANLGGGA